MITSIKAGTAYFAVVFAAGFVLGTLRVVYLLPRLGEHVAVLLELPVMLAISWIACRAIILRFGVPQHLGPRLAMGAIAFALLMMAELGVSIFALDRSLSGHLAVYATAPALLGLLGQIAFALFPALQMMVRPRAG